MNINKIILILYLKIINHFLIHLFKDKISFRAWKWLSPFLKIFIFVLCHYALWDLHYYLYAYNVFRSFSYFFLICFRCQRYENKNKEYLYKWMLCKFVSCNGVSSLLHVICERKNIRNYWLNALSFRLNLVIWVYLSKLEKFSNNIGGFS